MGVNAPRSPDGGYRPSEEPDHVRLDPMWSGIGNVDRVTYFDPDALRRAKSELEGIARTAQGGEGGGPGTLTDVSALGAGANGAPAGSPFGQPGQSTVFRNMAQAHEDAVQELGRRYQNLVTALGQAVAGMAASANILDEAEQATTDSVRRVEASMNGDAAAPGTRMSTPSPPAPSTGSDVGADNAGGGSFEGGAS